MNIENKIVPQIITKYMNTLGNKLINKMTCSDTKYNFSIRVEDIFVGSNRFEFDDSFRSRYDYMVMIDSEIPVPMYVCKEYQEEHDIKDSKIGRYPLLWEFAPEMGGDLKYMGIDLTSITFGKAGISFTNTEEI